MSKKIVLVNASPRKGGNSDCIIKFLVEKLENCDVTIFNMMEKDVRFCLACGACQGKDTQNCVQKDDYTALLPILDECDGIVLATPIYNQQITSRAKLFFERMYPFFKFDDSLMTNSKKKDKKAALVCSFWGSPVDVTTKYSEWTAKNFGQMGADKTKALIFSQIPEKGDVLSNPDYMNQLKNLAEWLAD